MTRRIKIPQELLILNPTMTLKELRSIVSVIWNSRNNRVRNAYILNISVPHLGTFKSHANKKPKSRKKTLKRDRERKRKLAAKKNVDKLL